MNDLWDRIVGMASVVAITIGGFLYLIFIGVLTGIVFSSLWGWFVVPLGFPQISIPHAVGLTMIVSLLRWDSVNKNKPDSLTEAVSMPVAGLGSAWIGGYIWHSFK